MLETRQAIEDAGKAAEGSVWEARKEGAGVALEEARAARETFLATRFDDLAAELMEGDEKATAAIDEAWSALNAAANALARQQRAWRVIATYGGVDPESLPAIAPLAGIPLEVRQALDAGVESPTPRSLR